MRETTSNKGVSTSNAVIAKNISKVFSGNYTYPLVESLFGRTIKGKNDFQALNDVSFIIRKGEAVGILGENGSGKSTLLQIIAKTLKPSSGTVQTNGKLAALLELGSGFNPDFTGKENIYLNASILGLSKEQTSQVLDQILDFADIGDFVNRPLNTYSSGMMMRLAFAVQIFVEPEILIVDEALSVGDQFFKLKCFEKLNALLEKGITFLYVSHNEETLRGLTNRALVLHHGKLVMDGGVQECMDEYNLSMGQKRRTLIPDLTRKPELKWSHLNPSTDRRKEARILHVQVLNEDEKQCDHFQSGDIVKVALAFVATGHIDGLSAGLRIRNKEGAKIYSWATANQETRGNGVKGVGEMFQSGDDQGGSYTVQYEFLCNLGANLYQVEAFITDDYSRKEKDVLDWVSEAAFLKVDIDKADNFFGGVCDLKMKAVLKKSECYEHNVAKIDYGRLYDGYWALPERHGSESFDDATTVASEIMKLLPDGKILDFGCGMGSLVDEFTSRGFDIIGIDPSRKAIEYCQENCEGSFQTGSILHLPFEDESFDTVISTDCLEHIAEEDLTAAIREIARVTKSQVYLRIATRPDRDKKWHLTVKPRKWWEDFFIRHGFRLHPITQKISPFENLELETKEATLCLEKIPKTSLKKYTKEWLLERRDLHTDMLRESNRRSDAHIARYQLARELSPQSGQVLDAACGMGYGSHILGFGRTKLNIIGVDMEQEAIDYCNANFSLSGGNLEFKTGEVEELNVLFPAETFDMVCSFETVEHIKDPRLFLLAVRSLLKPNGIFICSVPNMWCDEKGKDPNPHHLHVFDFEKIVNLVAQALEPQKIYSQIAGNGNRFPDNPRTLRECEIGIDYSQIEAEWCLLVARKV
ncbi:MAG: methyltransferase domain-containing protein [Opitutae bacterium]|jgi:ABC-type polysaccharide/polyol phosphate transport system ATPase subunit/2-polyprenyl-3-methyl-5-hydroxy-6-metoxy-1,4-benzoquinol methylase|nr:methyltransferase domain-containing protein [Opitutae bacterium]